MNMTTTIGIIVNALWNNKMTHRVDTKLSDDAKFTHVIIAIDCNGVYFKVFYFHKPTGKIINIIEMEGIVNGN